MTMWMRAAVLAMSVGACAVDASPATASDLTASFVACATGGQADASALDVRPMEGAHSGVRVRNRATGLSFEVLYDAASRATAERCLPYLDAVYGEIAAMTAVDPATTEWHGVIFSETGELPDLPGERWPIQTVGGDLDDDGQRKLASVLPHEQTHAAVRMTANARALPRWYREGSASWVEQSLLARIRPDIGEARAARFAAAKQAVPDAPALKDWGPLRFRMPTGGAAPRIVNGQVVMQTAPEDAEMMRRESAYYARALDVFQWMEAEVGRPAMVRWIEAVSRSPSPPDTAELVRLAKTHTGLDLSSRLE